MNGEFEYHHPRSKIANVKISFVGNDLIPVRWTLIYAANANRFHILGCLVIQR